jgi:hypothetical protein
VEVNAEWTTQEDMYLDDSWVRIQTYVPEVARFKLRTYWRGRDDDPGTDSKIVAKVLYAFLNLSESQRDSLLDGE